MWIDSDSLIVSWPRYCFRTRLSVVGRGLLDLVAGAGLSLAYLGLALANFGKEIVRDSDQMSD